MAGKQELQEDPEGGMPLVLGTGGERYFLAGRPVHNGDSVEVQQEDGRWLAVRLEGMPGALQGHLGRLAGGSELVAAMPAMARYRWRLRSWGSTRPT
jgi:hypothetical protein